MGGTATAVLPDWMHSVLLTGKNALNQPHAGRERVLRCGRMKETFAFDKSGDGGLEIR
jgi:hypothetical protein